MEGSGEAALFTAEYIADRREWARISLAESGAETGRVISVLKDAFRGEQGEIEELIALFQGFTPDGNRIALELLQGKVINLPLSVVNRVALTELQDERAEQRLLEGAIVSAYIADRKDHGLRAFLESKMEIGHNITVEKDASQGDLGATKLKTGTLIAVDENGIVIEKWPSKRIKSILFRYINRVAMGRVQHKIVSPIGSMERELHDRYIADRVEHGLQAFKESNARGGQVIEVEADSIYGQTTKTNIGLLVSFMENRAGLRIRRPNGTIAPLPFFIINKVAVSERPWNELVREAEARTATEVKVPVLASQS